MALAVTHGKQFLNMLKTLTFDNLYSLSARLHTDQMEFVKVEVCQLWQPACLTNILLAFKLVLKQLFLTNSEGWGPFSFHVGNVLF